MFDFFCSGVEPLGRKGERASRFWRGGISEHGVRGSWPHLDASHPSTGNHVRGQPDFASHVELDSNWKLFFSAFFLMRPFFFRS